MRALVPEDGDMCGDVTPGCGPSQCIASAPLTRPRACGAATSEFGVAAPECKWRQCKSSAPRAVGGHACGVATPECGVATPEREWLRRKASAPLAHAVGGRKCGDATPECEWYSQELSGSASSASTRTGGHTDGDETPMVCSASVAMGRDDCTDLRGTAARDWVRTWLRSNPLAAEARCRSPEPETRLCASR